MLPTKKIDHLTPEQEQSLTEYRKDCLAYGRSTEPADRAAAEAIWREMYSAVGKEPPLVLWWDGPATGSLARSLLGQNPGQSLWQSLGESLGQSLGESLWQSLGGNLGQSLGQSLRQNLGESLGQNLGQSLGENLRESLWQSLGESLRQNLGESLGQNLGQSLRQSLRESLGQSLWQNLGQSLWQSLGQSLRGNLGQSLWQSLVENLGGNLGQSLGQSLRGNPRQSLWQSLGWAFWGQHELYWPAYYDWPDAALRRMHTPEQRERLNWWLTLSRSTGWWHPFEGVVMACERPLRQAVDEQGRLHYDSGPALLCRDGWPVWAWHGVRVPQAVIEQPETLTATVVLAEPNTEVRRVMVERMGYERFCREAAAKVLHQDTDGAGQHRRLLSVPLPTDDPERRLVAVEVTCPSTGHQYLLRVPPTVKRCDEAVAWTFGLPAKEYAPAVES